MFRSISFFIASIVFSSQLYATDVIEIEKGPLHEAFVTKEYGPLIYDALSEAPPNQIQEKIPERPNQYVEWLGGYWEWSADNNDFIWVSGVWRRVPPGHSWVPGKWQKFAAGWVRLPGFWSEVAEENLTFIDEMPPDTLDENVPRTPSSDYFWVLGNWEYDFVKSEFDWLAGRWQAYDENWVFVPAHYVWREEGYVYVGSYWDWPLAQRGQVYASVTIKPSVRNAILFEPSYIVEHDTVIAWLFPYWPEYLCLYHTHYHFYPDFWANSGIVVPWWGWNEWLSFTWYDQLWLWWWWSHPGFPQPFWLNTALAKEIPPPNRQLINLMKNVTPPLNVTKEGVVTNNALLEAIEKNVGDNQPLVPQELRETIQKDAPAKSVKRPFLRPEAQKAPEFAPRKPNFGPKREELKRPPKRIDVPKPPARPAPKEPAEVRRVMSRRKASPRSNLHQWEPRRRGRQNDNYQKQPRRYKPEKLPPSSWPSKPQYTPPTRTEPSKPTRPTRPRTPPPTHGTTPEIDYPREQRHSQHLDSIQTNPQPKVNPNSPPIHSFPDRSRGFY